MSTPFMEDQLNQCSKRDAGPTAPVHAGAVGPDEPEHGAPDRTAFHCQPEADRPQDLLRNSVVTPSLAAAIMNSKYMNAIPLYRLEQEFTRNGVCLSRQNMANWTIRCAERYLSLLWERMHRELLGCPVIQADETPVLVSKDWRNAGAKSCMWVYRTGKIQDAPVVVVLY